MILSLPSNNFRAYFLVYASATVPVIVDVYILDDIGSN
jgi:hypothetical protein